MKNKLFLVLFVIATLACVFAISVSASTVYVDADSNTELFKCEIADSYHIDSYEILNGGFAKVDSEGNALTWYLVGTETVGENVVKTVKSVKTSEVYSDGVYSNGVNKNYVVSANFDKGITTVPCYGAFSGSFNKELLFVYIPDEVTTLPYRFCQNVPVIKCEFSENSKCESWEDLTFWYAKSLRELFIPKNFKKFPSSKDGEFTGCVRMEKLTFHKESTLEVWPSWYFGDTKIKEIVMPHSITYLNSRAFQGMAYLETVYLSPNITHMYKNSNNHSLFHSCSSLKTVYIPKTLVAENLVDNYGGGFDYSFSSGTPTFVYTGTLEEFLKIKEIICKSSNNGALNSATVDNGRIVIADHCETFYGGHAWKGEDTMTFKDYLSDITIGDNCDNCGTSAVKEVIGALFTYHGYSCTEKAINGTHSVAQFFGVNNESVARYEKLTGKTVNFGIVATGNADGTAIKPLEKGDKVITQQFSDYPFEEDTEKNYFAVKVNGIVSDYVETNFIFCAYISVDGEVVYIDNNAQVTELAGISHSQLNSILN